MSTQTTDQSPGALHEHVTLTVNGKELTGRRGQSVAGVLWGSGRRIFTRSAKYHRPRGYTCGTGACGNCVLTLDGSPGTLSCQTLAEDGQSVRHRDGWPSTNLDMMRVFDLAKPLLPAGFQFRLFRRQPRLSALAGQIMSMIAGGGRMPDAEAIARSTVQQVRRHAPEVFIAGGGLSGLTAALAAAEQGRTVVVADAAYSGGRSALRTEPCTDGGAVLDAAHETWTALYSSARKHPSILLLRGQIIGLLDGVVPVVDGQIRHEVQVENLVIATGSYEVPELFENNDRPGVMLADGALRLAETEGVLPGSRIVVVTGTDRGHQVADRLRAAGCTVTAVVDSRSAAEAAATAGAIASGTVWSARPRRVQGWGRVRALTITELDGGQRIPADTVVVAGDRRPADELRLQVAYQDYGSHDHVLTDDVSVTALTVGTATGVDVYDLAKIRETVETWAAALGTSARDPR